MKRHPSHLLHDLEPLVRTLWPIFLFWSAVTAALWWTGEAWIGRIDNPGLRAAVSFIFRSADAVWLLVAALNLYLELAQREGIARARVVSLVVFSVAGAVAWASVATGYPLGSVVYTTQLGARLGVVPLGWPLLWFVIVLGARALITHLRPRMGHAGISFTAGFIALLTDFNLEPLATKFRLYWFWYVPGTTSPAPPPWTNYATWFLVAVALAWFARERQIASTRFGSTRAASIIVITNAVLLTGHLRGLLGH